jgi:CHAD domain-containing protein
LSQDIEDNDARAFVVEYLEQRLRAARSSALAALRSDRHDFLIEDLILLVSEPPVGPRAFEPVGTAILECVDAPWRKLRRSVKDASLDSPAEQWHRIRINAKKARYAAEAVAPIFGEGYRRLGKSLAWVTDTLGSRQDAQVSIHTLEEIAQSAPSPIAYRLGLHSATCAATGDEDVRAFVKRWPDIAHQAHTLGLR